MKIGEAIEELKKGNMVARTEWEPDNYFLFRQVPAEIKKDIVPKMQSLPQSVKDEFEKRFNDDNYQIDAIYYDDQIAVVNDSNLIVNWSPTVSDVLAEDWIVLGQIKK